jgi:hypothetical protein
MNAPNEVFTEALHIIKGGDRTSSIIAAAIKTSTLTVNEMGNILGAITDRICATACGKWPENPELEAIAHDLAETCEDFAEAQNKIEERLYETTVQEPEYEPTEEGDWK